MKLHVVVLLQCGCRIECTCSIRRDIVLNLILVVKSNPTVCLPPVPPSPSSSLQGETVPADRLSAVSKLIEPWFLFALVWSIGGTCDGSSRKKFDQFIRGKIKEANVSDVVQVRLRNCMTVCLCTCTLSDCINYHIYSK